MGHLERAVMETLKGCQERKEPPLIWALQVSKCVGTAGLELPSPELGEVLVSNLCFASASNPSLWKFLEQALSSRLCSSLHVLSLLSSRFFFSSHLFRILLLPSTVSSFIRFPHCLLLHSFPPTILSTSSPCIFQIMHASQIAILNKLTFFEINICSIEE